MSPESRRLLSAAISGLVTLAVVAVVGWQLVVRFWPDGDRPTYAALTPGAPTRIVVPALGVRAPVVPIDLASDGELDPPRDPEQVGWWQGSSKPGAEDGQVVITGHSVHTGGGSLDRIRQLVPGNTVDVRTGNGTMRYRVTRVEVYSRDSLAEHATDLFGQDAGDGRLVLVTCTDWDGTDYENNVVVFGDPLGVPEPKATRTAQASD